MRKGFLTILLGLIFLLSVSVLAETEVAVTPVVNQIAPSEQAKFDLQITNREASLQRYSIYSLQSGQGWNLDPSPLKDKIVELAPGESKTVRMVAQPLESFTPGIYHLQVNIEGDLGDRIDRSLKIYLGSDKHIEYLPSITATIDMDEKIKPTEPVSIKLFLENRNPLNLSGLKIKIQSDIPEFVKEVTINLPPLQKKTVEFTVMPDEFQQPKDYTLFFVFERDGQTVKVLEQDIEILSLLPPFTVDPQHESVFLKTFTQLTITNDGNVLNTQDVKIPVSFWHDLLTSGDVDSIKEDGQRYLVWEVTLGPNESMTVQYVTNFRLLFYIGVVILLFVIFYLVVQRPVVLHKSAVTTKSGEDGALSEIKVTLELRNKGKKPLKKVSVIDVVPAIANVEKSLELGTLRPEEIKHSRQGTKVVWSLAELDTHEHRLITYKIKAKLNILGTFSLPRATVEYSRKKGKKKKAFSNVFRLSA